MIYLYHCLFLILTIFYPFIFLIRVLKKKEDINRWLERLGIASVPRSEGHLIWLHGASLGESIAALNLIEHLNKIRPDLNFLLSTATLSSARYLAGKLPGNTVHQFQPIDNILSVKLFLRHWQPNLGIFFESELWPALLRETAKKCDLLLLNACISEKSFSFWYRINNWFPSPAEYFSEIIAQSLTDQQRFQTLSISKVTNLGNIKFANKKLIFSEDKYLKLNQHLAGKKIIVFASTHAADEQVILNILPAIKKYYPEAYFILIPRHPHRASEIVLNCQKLNITYALSSLSTLPELATDLYIVDEFGVLGLYYNLSYISFVGGSFNIGGHNILEPAHFDNLIIFGPCMDSCLELAHDMIAKQAAVQIQNQQQLYTRLKYFLSEQGECQAKIISENAKKFVEQNSRIIDDYLKIIIKYIDDKINLS